MRRSERPRANAPKAGWGFRSGHYPRKLITRAGTLELRVPQDRQGRFSTEIFSRYQRSKSSGAR